MTARTSKEAIYDDEISPLLKKILEICKTHKIAMLSEFCLGYDDDNPDSQLCCTSALLTEDHEPTERIKEAFNVLKPQPQFMTITTVSKRKK